MNYDIQMVKQPTNMKTQLFKHQLASIFRMEKLEDEKMIEYKNFFKKTKIGFNSDISGYGKTNSMIGLIIRDKMEWNLDVPFNVERNIYESNCLIENIIIERYKKLPTTLILVPNSIIFQWENEIKKTDLIYSLILSKKDIDNINIEKNDIILITPLNYNNLIKSYSKYAWKRFIFDEPSSTRVTGMKDINAGFYWFVTSTPNSMIKYHQNCRNSMIHKIIDNSISIEDKFEGMIIRNDENFIKSSFEIPNTITIDYYCNEHIFNIINGLVSQNINKMIEIGNIEGAILALGGNKTQNIVELIKQKKLEEIEKIKSNINIYTIRQNDEKIEYYKQIEKRIYKQIEDLEFRFNNMLNNTCHICMENIKEHVLEPNCQNIFCGNCIIKWLDKKKSCPLCRSELNFNDLIYIKKKDDDLFICDNKSNMLSKIEQIIKIIKNKQNGKFLIFSDYDEKFNNINKIFKENNLQISLLKGNNQTRNKIINEYKNSNSNNIIFINSTIDSAGIDLIETTDIILYHEMSKNIKYQIISRALRIGRTKELFVHQLKLETS